MNALWLGLLANLAVIALCISLWIHVRDSILQRWSLAHASIFGLLMAGGAVLLLHMPFELRPGVLADLRMTLPGLSGFFGGPVAGLICGALVALYRLQLGGAGALSGCLGIGIATAVGLLGHRLLKGRMPRKADILLFSTVLGPAPLLSLFALPTHLWQIYFQEAALPVALLVSLATALAGFAIHQDDRRREIVRANRMYRAIIEALPDSLNAKDLQGRFLAANPATAKLVKAKDTASLIGRTDFDFYPEEIARQFRADEERVVGEGRVCEVAQRYSHADGSGGWLWTLKAPFRDETGDIVGLVTHNRDITDWKRMEDEVALSRKLLAEALAHMADALVMFDSDGRLAFCNAQYQALFPLTASVRVPGAIMPDILQAALATGEAPMPEDPVRWIGETCASYKIAGNRQIRLADGRWLDARTRPMDGGGFLVVYSDITQTKRAEEVLLELNAKLEASAKTDGLTGLANRRAFDDQLERDLAMSARTARPVSLLLIDVDRFKAYNDTYGHLAGDECLRAIANCLKDTLKRTTDTAARYGGEELAAVLPDTDSEGAFRIAEEFLATLRELHLVHDGSEKAIVTASVGIASIFSNGTPHQSKELIRRADIALYGAKTAGRDRVHGWRPRLEAAAVQKRA